MRKFMLLAVLVHALMFQAAIPALAAEPVAAGRPNIVFIMADDME